MPGIVGIVHAQEQRYSESLLTNMAAALKDYDWYQDALYSGNDVGLGRVSLTLRNQESQPVWNEAQNTCLVLEGELFDYDSLKQRLLFAGHTFRSDSHAEFVLRLYEAYGEEFAVQLNGAFSVAIWDGRFRKLIIANDRLGLHPLYYAHHQGDFLFASGIRALLTDSRLQRQVDPVAVAQLLTFDHMLNDRTLLAAVKILPPASLLTFQEGQLAIRTYWTMRYAEHYRPISEEAYLEELLHYLRQAARRQAAGKEPAAILLSGGLDSRILLGLLTENGLSERLSTYTFGIPGCHDGRFAQEIANRSNVTHQFFELEPDYLISTAEKAVRLTDGMQNCVHMHALATLDHGAKEAQIFYKGFLGDAMMGYSVKRLFWANYNPADQIQRYFQTHVEQGIILFEPAEHEQLFTEQFRSQFTTGILDEYETALMGSGAALMADKRSYFDLRQRNIRMILHGVELVRSRGVVRLPFCDNDLLDFSLDLPPGLRFERYLIKRVLIDAFPELAKVPYTGSGYPIMPCLRDTFMHLNSQIRWRLRDAGLGWIPPAEQSRPYADYHTWFRTTLRSWVEDILLDRHTLERGYFDATYIRNLVAGHMAGSNHATRLGALISLELWHRQFLD
jgi:asparagine synthase (glutamine-hydrolysing)